MKHYKYIIVGGGICGCSTAFELSKISKNILLIDKNKDVALGASGAAGAFLSPLLGKPNSFKNLVTKALLYATKLYKENFKEFITTCGTVRIPKDAKDKEKFESYKPYMDFDYVKNNKGYFFEVGSVVESYNLCKKMVENIDTKFNYDVTKFNFDGIKWIVNGEFSCEKLILATGYENELLAEKYIQIRAVWGRRIDISSTTQNSVNYHKACSISRSILKEDGLHYLSIGATHHRDKNGVEDIEQNHKELLEKTNDVMSLENMKIINDYVGARACSVDYFPMIGTVIDSKKTLEEFPYMRHGTHVQEERFTRYKNLYIINGVGGRGFVLAPLLAKELVLSISEDKKINTELTVDRFFKRAVKKRDI